MSNPQLPFHSTSSQEEKIRMVREEISECLRVKKNFGEDELLNDLLSVKLGALVSELRQLEREEESSKVKN